MRAERNEEIAYVYMLECRDGRYYVGITRKTLEARIGEHNAGVVNGFTRSRRPVRLVFYQEFQRITDAIAVERQIKGWSRAKKKALIRGDFDAVRRLSKRHRRPRSSFETPRIKSGAPQDEEPS